MTISIHQHNRALSPAPIYLKPILTAQPSQSAQRRSESKPNHNNNSIGSTYAKPISLPTDTSNKKTSVHLTSRPTLSQTAQSSAKASVMPTYVPSTQPMVTCTDSIGIFSLDGLSVN